MRFSVAAVATLAAGAFAQSSSAVPSYTTEVVTSFETYCPEATSFVHGSTTYSVSKPTTLTLSGGSYTVGRPLLSSTVTYCNSCAGPTAPVGTAPVGTAPAGSSPSSAPSVAPVYSSSGIAVTSTPAATTPASPAFTGGASRVAGAGAGLAGLFGVAAFFL